MWMRWLKEAEAKPAAGEGDAGGINPNPANNRDPEHSLAPSTPEQGHRDPAQLQATASLR